MSSSSGSSSRVAYPVTAGMTGDYRSFDRSTRAGRLLHNLYQPNTKESTLDPELLKRLEANRKAREAAEHPKVKPVPKSRAYVELPEAPRKEYPKYLPPIGRRPLALIQQNEREENLKHQQQAKENEAANGKQARTDEDKFRLQHKFQFGVQPSERLVQAFNAERTRVVGTVAEGTGITHPFAFSTASVAREQRQEKERLIWTKRFDEINAEIADRKAYLAELEEHGHEELRTRAAAVAADGGLITAATSHAAQKVENALREKKARVTNELRELIKEMKEINERLREMDE